MIEFEGDVLIDHDYNKHPDLRQNCKNHWYEQVAFVEFCGTGPADYYLAGQ